MGTIDPRTALTALVESRGESFAALSRLIGRNDAYLQQFVTRGSPRALAEGDRRVLAAYLGADEALLGGPASTSAAPALVRIPRIDAVASAGPGGLLDGDRVAGGEAIDPALLRQLGVGAANLSLVTARGESMLPTIADGDDMLVDRADTRVTRHGGIYVVRLDGALMVKRLVRGGAGIDIISDNTDFPVIAVSSVEVIGRVVRLTRMLR